MLKGNIDARVLRFFAEREARDKLSSQPVMPKQVKRWKGQKEG